MTSSLFEYLVVAIQETNERFTEAFDARDEGLLAEGEAESLMEEAQFRIWRLARDLYRLDRTRWYELARTWDGLSLGGLGLGLDDPEASYR
jgi:hypothetical protein